jgi:hypothetical protein
MFTGMRDIQAQWEANASEAELAALEAQGFDLRDLRARRAAQAAAEAAEAEQRRIEREHRPRPQLARLQAHLPTPRSPDDPFFKATAGKPPMLFGKKAWLEGRQHGAIVFGATVQANEDLYDPGNEGAPLVTVIARHPARRHDVRFLVDLAERLAELRDGTHVPADCKKLVASLRDQQSIFNWQVGASLAGDADAWCGSIQIFERSLLPHRCLPADGVLPFVLFGQPRDGYSMDLTLVPPAYYM